MTARLSQVALKPVQVSESRLSHLLTLAGLALAKARLLRAARGGTAERGYRCPKSRAGTVARNA
jgi:hypothetical protein